MKLNEIDEVWKQSEFRNFATMATWRNDFPSLLWTLYITPAVSVLRGPKSLESRVLSGKAWPVPEDMICTRISYLTQCALCRIWSHGTKNTLLGGKQRNGSLKRKDISFLKDVTALFSVSPSFAIQQDLFCTDRILQRAHRIKEYVVGIIS